METDTANRKDRRIAVVTGGMGFIGSHLINYLLDTEPNLLIYNLDSVTYAAAGCTRFLNRGTWAWTYNHPTPPEPPPAYKVKQDLRHEWLGQSIVDCDKADSLVRRFFSETQPHVVYHLAAQSHVDRSIDSAAGFTTTNVVGTQSLLECARLSRRLEKFVYVSTDEVYGSVASADSDGFTEASLVQCGNPYSATKASGEQLALAYHNTYGLPVVITRGCNTYGSHQFPEKLIPLACCRVLQDLPVAVYGDGQQSRQWMHVRDHVNGLIAAAEEGRPGQIYNLSVGEPVKNIDIVKSILSELGRPESLIHFVPDRPGHDRHYRISAAKAVAELGWWPRHSPNVFAQQLHAVFRWYAGVEGQSWLNNLCHDTDRRLGLCPKESS